MLLLVSISILTLQEVEIPLSNIKANQCGIYHQVSEDRKIDTEQWPVFLFCIHGKFLIHFLLSKKTENIVIIDFQKGDCRLNWNLQYFLCVMVG